MRDQLQRSALSRRTFLRQATLGAAAATLTGCVGTLHPVLATQEITQIYSAAPIHREKPPMEHPLRPSLTIPAVSLNIKIGQMLMLGFKGFQVGEDEHIVHAIQEMHVGNVVLFDMDLSKRPVRPRNIQSPEQLQRLCSDLQASSTLPLSITIDQEGGVINRLKDKYGFPVSVSHAALGERDDLAYTHEQSATIARTLAAAGITLNLAPVVDVKVNPNSPIIARVDRSFSADPKVVAAQAEAFIDAHHAQGIQCTLKHFPGHGSAMGDTHLGFTDVTHTWSDAELLPYRHLIGQGKADAIMTAHIFHAHLDSQLPATLSPAIITGLLRERLGYDGVVISDDIQMRGITDLFTVEKAIELALVAGVDMIAIANNLTDSGAMADRFFATVNRLLDKGILTAERIDQSYRRIMRLKGLA